MKIKDVTDIIDDLLRRPRKNAKKCQNDKIFAFSDPKTSAFRVEDHQSLANGSFLWYSIRQLAFSGAYLNLFVYFYAKRSSNFRYIA